MKKVLKYLAPFWYIALLSPIFMIVEVLCDLWQPKLMASIVDDGVINGNMSIILKTGIVMLIIVIIGCLGGILSASFGSIASQYFSASLRNDAFKKVTTLSIEQTDKFTTGSLVTRLTNDITTMGHFISMGLRMFIRVAMQLVGGVFMMLTLNVKFGTVLLVSMPIQIFIIIYMIKNVSPLFSLTQKKLDKVNSVVEENVIGARVVKAYVKEEYETRRFDRANTELTDTTYKAQKIMAYINPLLTIVLNLSTIVIIIIGGYQVQAAKMNVGEILAATTYVTQILMSVMGIGMIMQNVTRAKASAQRIAEILECEPTVVSGTNKKTDFAGHIRFENVSFKYIKSRKNDVIDNVTLDIPSNKTLAILGATGSGKSTFIKLIPRFYDVDSGKITLDGIDIRDLTLENLRKNIATVLQKTEIFSGTVADNIRWGKEDATMDEVINAAKIAQAHDFIMGLENGYETVIGEKGSTLSGGQKQRLSIARAIIKNPKVLILDDSTSALDLSTEAKLKKSLK